MIQVTLVAPTPQEAYELARSKYGNNFALISARQIAQSGGDDISCEITISVAREKFLHIDGGEDEEELLGELSLLRDQIMQMKSALTRPRAAHEEFRNDTTLAKVHRFFAGRGISEGWLEEVLSAFAGTPVAEDEELLLSYLMEEIDERIIIKEERFSGAQIKMFVGPTGVGKSTTIAKLAARYSYMLDDELRVALVNLDSFKVGAFEQLSHYAAIMKLEHYGVSTIEDFAELMPTLEGYDVILVDTAGMSPYDTKKLVRTVEYLNVDIPHEIEMSLVIPVGAKREDLDTIFETFSFLNLDNLILSKFDETRHIGAVVSYLLTHPIALSYFTIGQDVPDDLIRADKEYLLEYLLGKSDEL